MPSRNAALNKIAANLRAARPACFICGMEIDWDAPPEDPNAFTVEHVYPRSTHPHLVNDPASCRAAHARCNKGRGNRPYAPGIGEPSKNW